MSEFFAMGGYAAYVWPAYGATVAVIAGVAFLIWRRGRNLKNRLAAYEASQNEKSGIPDA